MLMNSRFDWTRFVYKVSRKAGKIGIDKGFAYRAALRWIIPGTGEALALLKQRKLFLITSTGRTGTAWLAHFLNRRVDGLCVMHEPVPRENPFHKKAVMNPAEAEKYLLDFRFGEMALRCVANRASMYGEVNSHLRRHIAAFKKHLPAMKIIHVIRDGRDGVRSVMSRRAYTPEDKDYYDFVPPRKDIDPHRWSRFTRFEKLCWLWTYENSYMREHADATIRFEDMISNYAAFESMLLTITDMKFNVEQEWMEFVRKPKNITRTFLFPKWPEWSRSDKDTFIALCGEEMNRYGYEIVP